MIAMHRDVTGSVDVSMLLHVRSAIDTEKYNEIEINEIIFYRVEDPVITGRAQLNPEGGWEAREREARAALAIKRVELPTQPKKAAAKKVQKVAEGQRSLKSFLG